MEILIINTGGTFNKVYQPVSGNLIVPKDDKAIYKIVDKIVNCKVEVKGIIYKDSLDMTNRDREELLKSIKEANQKYIIVVHGTDTMGISAKFISKYIKDRVVIFTGAMVPFSIDTIEATSNLSMALAMVRVLDEGVYISMQGLVLPHNKIIKNRELGIFQKIEDK